MDIKYIKDKSLAGETQKPGKESTKKDKSDKDLGPSLGFLMVT